MARLLAIDWDQRQLRVVEASISGSNVQIVRAAAWPEEGPPTVAGAEQVGLRLKQELSRAGISPAPVLISVGRDRVILKELRHPPVPPAEEAALIRFQAVKEMTEAADDVVIDYVPVSDVEQGSERRALVLIARRDVLAVYQTICRVAGLKLQAVTPRPFGIGACIMQLGRMRVLAPPPAPAGAAVAMLAMGERWAELGVVRDDMLLFARSCPVSPTLAEEIRRSLTVYASQAGQRPVRAVYVADSGEHAVLRERLQGLLKIPVHSFDPFLDVEKPGLPATERGGFAGAAGLLYAYGANKSLPIDFVHPRQPKVVRNLQQYLPVGIAAAAALAILVLTCVAGLLFIGARAAGNLALKQQGAELDKRIPKTTPDDDKTYKAVKEWQSTNVVWLDDFYDLAADFPDPTNTRLHSFDAESTLRPAGKQKEAVARITLVGVTKDGDRPVDDLRDKLQTGYKITQKGIQSLREKEVPVPVLAKVNKLKDKKFDNKDLFAKELATVLTKEELHQYSELVLNQPEFLDPRYKVDPKQMDPNKTFDRSVFGQQFTIKVEGTKRSPSEYKQHLKVPPRPPARGGFPPIGPLGDFEGF